MSTNESINEVCSSLPEQSNEQSGHPEVQLAHPSTDPINGQFRETMLNEDTESDLRIVVNNPEGEETLITYTEMERLFNFFDVDITNTEWFSIVEGGDGRMIVNSVDLDPENLPEMDFPEEVTEPNGIFCITRVGSAGCDFCSGSHEDPDGSWGFYRSKTSTFFHGSCLVRLLASTSLLTVSNSSCVAADYL